VLRTSAIVTEALRAGYSELEVFGPFLSLDDDLTGRQEIGIVQGEYHVEVTGNASGAFELLCFVFKSSAVLGESGVEEIYPTISGEVG
jgi:hypothetical protein